MLGGGGGWGGVVTLEWLSLCSSRACSLYLDKKDGYFVFPMPVLVTGAFVGFYCSVALRPIGTCNLLSMVINEKKNLKIKIFEHFFFVLFFKLWPWCDVWKAYHDVMEEQLPGLTQLLVQHHVKEVIDEVTCREGTRRCVIFKSSNSLRRHSTETQQILLTKATSSSSSVSVSCFHDDSNGNQDASRRGAIHIHHHPLPFPATSCIHGDSFWECWKNNEVLTMVDGGEQRGLVLWWGRN